MNNIKTMAVLGERGWRMQLVKNAMPTAVVERIKRVWGLLGVSNREHWHMKLGDWPFSMQWTREGRPHAKLQVAPARGQTLSFDLIERWEVCVLVLESDDRIVYEAYPVPETDDEEQLERFAGRLLDALSRREVA